MESIDGYEAWIFASNRINLAYNNRQSLEKLSWSKLSDKDIVDLKAAFVSGQVLCCEAGKEFLEKFFGSRQLLAVLVNGWAYETLTCRDSEDKGYYTAKFERMKKWTGW